MNITADLQLMTPTKLQPSSQSSPQRAKFAERKVQNGQIRQKLKGFFLTNIPENNINKKMV